jgi:carboxymethylenebutenolidase
MTNQDNLIKLTVSDNTSMQAYTAVPSGGAESFPGLIVFQEAFGVNNHIRSLTERFAAEGFVAIAPELYHRTAPDGFTADYNDFSQVMPHMQGITPEGLEADTRSAWDWLEKHPKVQKGNIACIGYCMGGRTAFQANTILPFKAAVSYYGGRIVPDLIKKAESLHGPMLFFWGGLDKHISNSDIETIMENMRNAGKTYTNVEVSNADHGFFCDERASYNAQAAKESWAITLAFLKNKLAL